MFGFGATVYLFAAGMGAGLYLIQTCIDPGSELRRRGPRDMQLLARKVIMLAPVLVCVGSLFLLLDLTRPERFTFVFRNPDTSLISLGACMIVVFTLLLAFENILWNSSSLLSGRFTGIVRVVAALVALGIVLYTGFFLMGMKGVPFWRSLFIVFLFSVSAFSSGIGLYLLLLAASFRRARMPQRIRLASHVDSVLILGELLLLVLLMVVQSGGVPAAQEACARLVSGDLAWAFWIMLIGIGLVGPLVLDVVNRGGKTTVMYAAKGFAVIVGGFFLRYCIMEAGVRVLALQ